LDTIDISNLNRQFLFRNEHVDMSKALVLKMQIEKQNLSMKIDSYVGRIQVSEFIS
jgi:ubiquitin-like 1-activating enzyme E1 B